jgi:hypothetical protein
MKQIFTIFSISLMGDEGKTYLSVSPLGRKRLHFRIIAGVVFAGALPRWPHTRFYPDRASLTPVREVRDGAPDQVLQEDVEERSRRSVFSGTATGVPSGGARPGTATLPSLYRGDVTWRVFQNSRSAG